MSPFMEPLTCAERIPEDPSAIKDALHLRTDELLGRLHALTRRRDAGETSLEESMSLESALVVELGQIQDRLRILGCHVYDGCPDCRPRQSLS